MYKINYYWQYQPDNSDTELLDDPLLIIRDLSEVIIQYFDFNAENVLTIVDFPSNGNPTCLDSQHIIILATKGNRFFLQNAYQLAHELCHYIIREKSKIIDNNSWFEESICELCSIFFLKIIQLRWSVSPEPIKQSCSTIFNEYIEGIFARKKEFDLTTLSQNNSFEYRLLNDDEYKREHNNFIAQQLLPIFETNPNLWKEIFLIRTYNSSDLNTFFQKWSSDSSAENKDSILMIKQLFFN
ncbi:MAG: hypothetical protein ACTHVZ_05940 [Ruoffia tabacinasalis]